jgi:predicted TIM-barrel fold metal-dependent hydrolase
MSSSRATVHAGRGDARIQAGFCRARLHDDFDSWWRATTANGELRLDANEDPRNFDLDQRFRDLEADGVVAEVIYPNTLTPFARGGVQQRARRQGTRRRRPSVGGLRAYNRWAADWVTAAPHRFAAMAQISLHHIDESATEIRWARDAGLRGGVLLPGLPPGQSSAARTTTLSTTRSGGPATNAGMTLNHHGGSAAPHYGTHPGSTIIFLAEVGWFSHRALTFFILGGVLERHRNLRLVMSEQGAGWVPDHLAVLDRYASYGTLVRDPLGGGHLSLSPSEYFARQCYVGASFLAPPELAQLDRIGADRVLWGSDYPHREGTWPYSRESLALHVRRCRPRHRAPHGRYQRRRTLRIRPRRARSTCRGGVSHTGRCRRAAHHGADRHHQPRLRHLRRIALTAALLRFCAMPDVERPAMAAYGVPDDLDGVLPWSWADTRLSSSRNFWIVTASRDARPHAMPVWGVWMPALERFAFSCAPRHARRATSATIRRSSWPSTTPSSASRSKDAHAPSPGAAADPFVDAYARKYETIRTSKQHSLPSCARTASSKCSPERAFGIIEREDEFAQRATRWVWR